MADQSQREIRYCRHCGNELTSWKSPYCSDQCYELGTSENPPMPDKPVPELVKELDEPKQPATEPAAKPMNPPVQKHCRVCGEQLDEKHHKYCSTECWRIAKANKSSASSEPRQAQQQSDPMHEEAAREPVIAKTVKNQTVSKRGILGEGAPTKCTPELIEAVVR